MSGTNMRLWAGLFALVVFVAGLAAGVAIRSWVGPSSPPRFGPPDQPGVPPPARMTERLLDRIGADLDLTAEQDQQLREVFETRQDRLRTINEEVRGRFEAEQMQMSAEIAGILTPEQLEIFATEILRMRQERRGPRGRDPRGGLQRGPRRGPG